jgi:hypothetical protein
MPWLTLFGKRAEMKGSMGQVLLRGKKWRTSESMGDRVVDRQ